ncbi:MAG TPA: hypothetical protein VHT49_12645 [Acidimicrobiales bacterium]|jgi:hypothetical protein|nr:hypothetical protein [Acidimicrobiales bacterium]
MPIFPKYEPPAPDPNAPTPEPVIPPTAAEVAAGEVAKYLSFARSELDRANKAGRLDAQAVHANRASAAATIALVIQTVMPAE